MNQILGIGAFVYDGSAGPRSTSDCTDARQMLGTGSPNSRRAYNPTYNPIAIGRDVDRLLAELKTGCVV